jgi:hypothetical protein
MHTLKNIAKLSNCHIVKLSNNIIFFALNVMKCQEMSCFYLNFFLMFHGAGPGKKSRQSEMPGNNRV